jgi:aminodeoxyfutalosine deaminase
MTATADISRWGSGAGAMAEAGLHGVCFHEMVAVDAAGFDAAFSELLERVEATVTAPGRRSGISPHSPYSLSAGTIKKLSAFAGASGLPACIHVAETLDEVEMIHRGSGPLSRFFARFIETGIPPGTGLSPVAYLDSLSALGASTLAVHCVHIDQADVGLIKKQGTAVALCPSSNRLLSGKEAPVALLEQAGVRYGAGTDSAAGDTRLDLFEELRAVRQIARRQSGGAVEITADRLLRSATIGAAEILGLDDEIGSLAPGKLADMAVLRPPRGTATRAPADLVDWATRETVEATILGGEIVYDKNSPGITAGAIRLEATIDGYAVIRRGA